MFTSFQARSEQAGYAKKQHFPIDACRASTLPECLKAQLVYRCMQGIHTARVLKSTTYQSMHAGYPHCLSA